MPRITKPAPIEAPDLETQLATARADHEAALAVSFAALEVVEALELAIEVASDATDN